MVKYVLGRSPWFIRLSLFRFRPSTGVVLKNIRKNFINFRRNLSPPRASATILEKERPQTRCKRGIFPHYPSSYPFQKPLISHTRIRARYEPGFGCGRVISGIVCKKQYILPHFFKIRHFLAIDANRGVLAPIEKTSTDAFGGHFSVKTGGCRHRSKRTPVLAPCFRGP